VSRHLVVALSAHGYGHGAQTAAVLNALRAVEPALRLTLLTTLPRDFLARRIDGPYALIARETDIGMAMADALEVRREVTRAAYARFHEHWPRRIEEEARFLESLAPDLVLANAPYLALAGAQRAGIPNLAMCSLNWADIYAHYFGRDRLHGEMLAAYRAADAFLHLEPGMPMPELGNTRTVGPVARLGRDRRREICARLGTGADTRLVLVAPGGVGLRLPIERWPRMPGHHFLVPASWGVSAPGVSAWEGLDTGFTDVLRSVDAVIGKPGYGTFVEAACNGTAMLYVQRGCWPEAPYLIEWLHRHGRALALTRAALERGAIAAALEQVWRLPAPNPPAARGAAEAASACLRALEIPRQKPYPQQAL
jgi:hypothetical protein